MDYREIYKKNHGIIPPNYEIHHKDGNHINNDIKNLVAMPKEKHQEYHRQKSIWETSSPYPYEDHSQDDGEWYDSLTEDQKKAADEMTNIEMDFVIEENERDEILLKFGLLERKN